MANENLDAFTAAMKEVYFRAKSDAGYDAKEFFRMVQTLGGLETAKRLLGSSGNSDGYIALAERNRINLTMEYLIVQPQWRHLFTKKELAIALSRLPKEIHPAILDPSPAITANQTVLQSVQTAAEIAENVKQFQVHSEAHKERLKRILHQTSFWIFDSRRGIFAPSKFAGYRLMSFEIYEKFVSGDFATGSFDGYETRTAIEAVLGQKFVEDIPLVEQCLKWGRDLLGSDTFDSIDTSKWRFL